MWKSFLRKTYNNKNNNNNNNNNNNRNNNNNAGNIFAEIMTLKTFCNALIQPHFHYACSTWYPNLDEKLENEIKSRKVIVSIVY